MSDLNGDLQPLLLRFNSRLRGRLSQHWISSRKPQGVPGIWLAYSETTPYYQGCQYNIGIYEDGLHIGLVIPWSATHDRQRIAGFVSHNPKKFLNIARRLRGSRAYIEYGNYWNFVSDLEETDLEKILLEMKHADWFTLAEWFRPKDKRPDGRWLLSLILRTFASLQPVYTAAIGLDAGFEKKMTRMRVISTKDIAAKEAWSMKIVKRFERREGRVPKDVSLQALGYDIVSEDEDGKERFIEVKSRVGGFPLELTDAEYAKANQLRKDYYLYVVSGEYRSPQLSLINNPVRSCRIHPVRTVSWRIMNWQSVAGLMPA